MATFRQLLIKQWQTWLQRWETNLSITPQPIHFHLKKLSVTRQVPARLSPETEIGGGGGGGENDSSTSFNLKSFCFRVYKMDLLSFFLLSEQEPEPEDLFGNQSETDISATA